MKTWTCLVMIFQACYNMARSLYNRKKDSPPPDNSFFYMYSIPLLNPEHKPCGATVNSNRAEEGLLAVYARKVKVSTSCHAALGLD